MVLDKVIKQAFDAKYVQIGEDKWHDTPCDAIYAFGWEDAMSSLAQPGVSLNTDRLLQLARVCGLNTERDITTVLRKFAQLIVAHAPTYAWETIQECNLKHKQLIYAHRVNGEVVEAIYHHWPDHKNPHRIESEKFGNECINHYMHVMYRDMSSFPMPPGIKVV